MPGKNTFVAGLFVFALCAFTIAGIELYQRFDIKQHSQPATMALADPDQKVVLYDDAIRTRTLDVRYSSDAGEVIVRQKAVPEEVTRRLAAGESIPVTYLTNNHHRVFYRVPDPPVPWAWLIVGVVTLATAIFALKLRKREASQ